MANSKFIQNAIEFKRIGVVKLFKSAGYDFMNEIEFPVDYRITKVQRHYLLYDMMPPICRAALSGDLQIFKLLVGYGCPLNSVGYVIHDDNYIYKTSPLGLASAYGKRELVKYILGKISKSEVDFKCVSVPLKFETLQSALGFDPTECTPLMLALIIREEATADERFETIELLIKKKADTSVRKSKGDNLLHMLA